MIKQLLEEVRAAPLDEASRNRLREIHQSSIRELEDGLAPELREELRTELARSAHGKTPEAVRAHAKQKLKETVTAKVTNTMTISHEADVMGMKHAHLRLREAQMNELQARALAVTSLNRNEPVAVRLADGLLKLLSLSLIHI